MSLNPARRDARWIGVACTRTVAYLRGRKDDGGRGDRRVSGSPIVTAERDRVPYGAGPSWTREGRNADFDRRGRTDRGSPHR
jgi:hypothetical protein